MPHLVRPIFCEAGEKFKRRLGNRLANIPQIPVASGFAGNVYFQPCASIQIFCTEVVRAPFVAAIVRVALPALA
jgi:hypothetical protein